MVETIVIGVDGSEPGHEALRFAADLTAPHEPRFILVHALLRAAPLEDLFAIARRLGFLDAVKPDLQESEAVVAHVTGLAPPIPRVVVPDSTLTKIGKLILAKSAESVSDKVRRVETRLSAEEPRTAVVGCAKEISADLIVVGSRGLGGVKGFLIGSVSRAIVQDAPCACLVVK